jgi:thymidylate synthase (FAD)
MRKIDVLDHGYVQLVETWGSDERVIEAARMSTSKGFNGWGTLEEPGDEKLLGYLYRNRHSTPFEMAGLVIEVQAPIFVFREWHRHRTQSFSEMSARYAPVPDVNYVPTVERLMMSGGKNKQAGAAVGAETLTELTAEESTLCMRLGYEDAENRYKAMLAHGVPKELARLVLPVGRYSRMRASASLRNWLHFLGLRMDPAAQWEIQQYAQAVHSLLTEAFPRTMTLFDDEHR